MLQDFRYAFRTLLKSPRFSVAAVLALAIGIGANTAMFSVVYNVLLRPLPYPQPDRLVFVQENSVRRGNPSPTAPATFFDWRDQQHVFQSIAAAEAWGASLTGSGQPEEIPALHASPSLLEVLQVAPAIGRGFVPGDDKVVLLGYGLWQRRFGAERSVVGRDLILNGESYRVIGVMPKGFQFPPFWQEKAQLWAPLVVPPRRMDDRLGRSLRVFARLKRGETLAHASAEMSTIARRLELAWPQFLADRGAVVIPLTEVVVGSIRRALMVLLGAVVFLLLIACANVANLLLAHGSGRRKEIALRIALGSSRWRLVRQLLAESLLLSAAGAALALLLSSWAVHALAASIPEASRFTLPRYQEIGIGAVVLLFTAAVSSVTGILFGIAPALQFSRPDPQAVLKEGGRGSSRQARSRLGRLLVVSEVAVSLMLLAGASLMVRSFVRLGAIDAGFDPRHLLTMRVVTTSLPPDAVEQRTQFYRRVLERVAEVPGVQSVSGINHLPLAGDLWGFSFTVEGRPAPTLSNVPNAAFRVVFPGYFRTMGIPLIAGRDFNPHDAPGSLPVVAVNEAMARRYWPGESAVGKRIRLGGPDSTDAWVTVTAVVKNVEQQDWGTPVQNEFYFPYTQNPKDVQRYLTLVVRTTGNPLALTDAVERQVWSLDRDIPISDVLSMEQVVDRAVWQPRFSTTLLSGFAGLALLLAAVGIYGVISYGVSQRVHEIGVRLALGAQRRDVLRSVLAEAGQLAFFGMLLGLAGAFAVTRFLRSMLYEVSAMDPWAMGAAAVILGGVALTAALLPARRATKVDPVVALRGE